MTECWLVLYNMRTYMEYIYEEIDGEYTGSKVSCTGGDSYISYIF